MPDLASLSTMRRIYLGSAVLLFINSFLPWYHESILGRSFNASGWHDLGSVAWLLVVVLLAFEGARIGGVLRLEERRAALFSSVISLAVVAVGAIFVIQRITSDIGLGFAFFLGLILLAGLGYSGFTAFRESGGADAVRKEVDERRSPPVA